jgi:hypothetical protein
LLIALSKLVHIPEARSGSLTSNRRSNTKRQELAFLDDARPPLFESVRNWHIDAHVVRLAPTDRYGTATTEFVAPFTHLRQIPVRSQFQGHPRSILETSMSVVGQAPLRHERDCE